MSNNIGIAIPNNYNRAPIGRIPVPTRSRTSSLPHMGNYTLSSNQRYQNTYNTANNNNTANNTANNNNTVNNTANNNNTVNNTANNTNNHLSTDTSKENIELRNQIENLTRNLNDIQSRIQSQSSQDRSVQYNNNVIDELVKEEGEHYQQEHEHISSLSNELQVDQSRTNLTYQQEQEHISSLSNELQVDQSRTNLTYQPIENSRNGNIQPSLSTSLELLTKRTDKLEMFYSKEIDDLTRTVSVLRTQFTHLETGYRNISSALTNIVEELEQSPDEDVILTIVDEKLDIKDVDNQSDSIDNSEQK